MLPLLLTLAIATAPAQDTAPRAQLKLEKTVVAPGASVKGVVTVTFEPGLHAYQNPPTESYQIPVKLAAEKGTTLVRATYPQGVPFTMAGEEKPSMVYEGSIDIPVVVKAPAKVGKTTVKLVLHYQQCNDSSCFPPGKVDLSSPLVVQKPKPAPKKPGG